MTDADLFAQVSLKLSQAQITEKHDSDRRLPGSRMEWMKEQLPEIEFMKQAVPYGEYVFSGESPLPFTGFAIGWKAEGAEPAPHKFHLEIRTRAVGDEWSDWIPANGYLSPADSPSELYWSIFYITPDGRAHTEFEVKMETPAGSALSYFLISAADARFDSELSEIRSGEMQKNEQPGKLVIIGREKWWGNLPEEELEPGYTPVPIETTHGMVHHTVTSNEPPDPAQVIRNIWNWHVNDNGWLDIGYNFLIDHFGNIYHGRYNPDLETGDVQAAHAGRANSVSVGIGLLGQFHPGAAPDSGQPREYALEAVSELIAWRFSQKQINPNGEAIIPVNPGGSKLLPNILGHRDVSATACPGDNLYQFLPDIRQRVSSSMVQEEDDLAEKPVPFELHGNYPNPFRSVTTITFTIHQPRNVVIDLYTLQGARIMEVFRGTVDPGLHSVEFNGAGLASGVYFCRMRTGELSQVKQMLYVR